MRNSYVLLLFIFNLSYAQDKSGYQWIFSNHNYIDFRINPPIVGIVQPYPFHDGGDNGTTISNKYGDLMFQSGGCFIANRKFNIMKNGDSINSYFTYRSWCKVSDGDGDFPLTQNSIALHYPEKDSFYFAFNLDFEELVTNLLPMPNHLLYSIIDMRQDSGLGAVVENRKIAITDTLSRGYVTAIKHKNNIDWWVIVGKLQSNCFFSVRVTPNGVEQPVKSCTGAAITEDDLGGQAAFSADGKRYARTHVTRIYDTSTVSTIFVYDFDNNTGQFSNQKKLTIQNFEPDFFQGVIFSPSGRFLYTTFHSKLYQFDLEAQNIQASSTLIADYTYGVHNNDVGDFYACYLAVDGKVYISGPGNHLFLSTINRPNCPGKLCDFRAYSVPLKFNNYGGITSTAYFEQPPANYNCDSLTATENVSEKLYIYPNPANTNIIISSTYDFKTYEIVNTIGQKLLSGNIKGLSDESIDVSGLTNGIYILRLTNESKERVAIKKFTVIK